MKEFKIKAKFVKPYLQDRFTEDAQKSLSVRSGTKAKSEDEEMWKPLLYKDDKGGIYIPSIQIREALVNAGKGIKKKPYGNFKETVQSYFIIEPDKIFLNKKQPDFLNTSYPARKDGQRVKKIHPGIDSGTEFEFKIKVTNDELDNGTIKQIMEKAGLEKGLGAWRSGGHGRFEIVKIT